MSQPTVYNRVTSFTTDQAVAPTTPLNGANVDAELNGVKTTIDQILTNLAIIQRDDTHLANASVGLDQLDTTVVVGFNLPTAWVTAHAYAVTADAVFNGVKLYRCAVSHTSGTFATDLAAGKWTLLADFTPSIANASNVAFTPAQGIVATNTQAAVVEVKTGVDDITGFRTDISGGYTTAGTSAAYVLTTGTPFASLAAMNNQPITFIPHATSAAAATLAVDGLAPKNIRTATGTNIPARALVAGTPYEVVYYNGVGEFIITGGGSWVIGPSTPGVATSMAADYVLGTNAAVVSALAEAGIWTGKVYNGALVAKTFDSSHNSSGPGLAPNSGVFSFIQNNGVNNDAVAVLGDVVVAANSSVGFGANFIARNNAGVTGSKLVGCELDVEFAAGTVPGAGSAGLYINIFNAASAGAAIQTGGLGAGTWTNGLVLAGLEATISAGVAPSAGASMGALVNSGVCTYGLDAIVLSNMHKLRLSGTGSNHAKLYVDGSNFLHIVGGAAGTAYRDKTDATSLVTVADDGTITTTGPVRGGAAILSTSASGGIGYATGAGGAVTQGTSKSTGVTLNTACGAITVNGAALAGSAVVSFTLTNSAIAATDILVMNQSSGGSPARYVFNARCAAGSAIIDINNITGGSLSEVFVIQFAVIKGVNS